MVSGKRGQGRDGGRRRPDGGAPEAAASGIPASEAHPTTGLDETVHQRHRLGVLTITSKARQAEFGYLRETLGLTSGNLSTHLTVLEDAGLVRLEKGYEGRRPRTWVSITRQGREALSAELEALARLAREYAREQSSTQDNEQNTDMPGGGDERDK
jgi:DNA-binding MarR family transcriptional regulator